MNILVIGSGAREHAIVWKCLHSELVDRVFCAPGNAWIAMIAQCADIKTNDFDGLAVFAQEKLGKDGLTIVGPDNPLADGIVDCFEERGLLILGPTKQAALIESSKVFCKNFLTTIGVPTAHYEVFAFADNAKRYVREHEPPFVIKANGLMRGKGVIIAKNIEEADAAIDLLMAEDAGKLILIEEYLCGWECSFTVLSDGENFMPLPAAVDYKTLNGKNTGGMGGYSPVPQLTQRLRKEVCAKIVTPVIDGMREVWGHPFVGFLYAGLMITKDGPMVLEFNARLGDPEAQVILPRIDNPDFVELCYAAAKRDLRKIILDYNGVLKISKDALVSVVFASPGYPNEPKTGYRIYGLEKAAKNGALVFHAGTKLGADGNFLTDGGRVLTVVGRGKTIAKARKNAYDAASRIGFGNKDPKKGRQVYKLDIAAQF